MRLVLALLATLTIARADLHPRLLFPATLEPAVKERIGKDPLAADLQRLVVKRAEKILTDRTCEYRIPDGKRLLSESRLALNHVLHCSWAWRTTGDARFKERVVRELDAACALKDWNPSHFLDTAEMATAVAIGYDWLHPVLTSEQRQRYEDALLDKALRVVGQKHAKTGWWTGATNNWTQVCGAGMGMAAEAVKERDPSLCQPVIDRGRELIEKCKVFYEPDGAYPEGPSYWHYGTNYEVLLFAARESLAQEIDVTPLLNGSGDFMMHVTGPSRLSFNYADGNAYTEIPSPAQSWIATHFKSPAQAHHVRSLLERGLKDIASGGATGDLRFFPLHLLWLPAAGEAKGGMPLSARFNGEQSLAFFRSAWAPDAAWLAIKGGTGAASHGHLDAGAFVYEAGGVRWFHDLGKDDYNMPGYFGKNRWDYLRLTNFSHSTLVIAGKLQSTPKQGCPLLKSASADEVAIDLTPAYAAQADQVTRSARFQASDDGASLTDLVENPAGPVRWAIVTKASPKIDGERLILEEAGKRLVLTRLDKSGGVWEEYSLKPATEREQQNKGFHLMGFTAPPAEKLCLEVNWKLE
ncbi:heparinase II/III domain-containing protein [Luteolibacter luteus]|uniref:Heparinase II/III-like C-terminal domain-containing protein n=1 Tax=Luteolibacter luteus TaxID=2728835 RepID=A0A858RFV1_9BACT|nr:heparinase II/III family protein [Luteolibacter luteus]QJE95471.1 hypothetical protein HHL09_06645 [Luteolibacter luteus]